MTRKMMKKSFSIFIFFVIFYISSARVSEIDSEDDFEDYNEKVYKKYIKMDKQLKEMAEQSVKKILPYLLEAREHVNISSRCTRNLFDLITGFRKLNGWSFNFLDSLGKLQSGLRAGNIQMFGEYDECIGTTATKKGKVDFQGQFCSISIRPPLPKLKRIPGINGKIEGLVNATRNSTDVTKIIVARTQIFYAADIKLGLCVPSGCSKEDVSEILKYSFGEYINTTVSHCLKQGDIYFWTTKRAIIVSIFVFLGMLVFVSTSLDNTLESWKNKQLGFKSRLLQCFSLTRNFPKLMSTEVSEKSITCFHGIRVLTIFWIILGHEYFMHAMALTANHGQNYEKMLDKFFSQIVLNGFINVDMFIFMSGFVNAYMRMRMKQEGKPQPSFLKIIFHRLWRIYPAYITSFLLMYIMNKPQAHHYHLQREFTLNCDKYWWRNMLFINNYFDPYKMCMAQSWYLCVDMQLFFLALLTVPILLKKPMTGIILHISLILIVNFGSMTWWLIDYIAPSTLDGTRLDRSESVKSFQLSIYTTVHLGPYFIGILLGYLIATKKVLTIPKVTQLFGWLTASLFFTSMVFMTLRWNSGIPYTHIESAFYGAWSRTVMVLGFSWMVFCCVTGRAVLINYILSLKLWFPLSRLVYMIYLVSPIVQAHYGGNLDFPEDFSDMRIIWNFFADLTISVLLSFALVLLVESPVIAMEKVLFRKNDNNNKASFEVSKDVMPCNKKENGVHENGKFTSIHL